MKAVLLTLMLASFAVAASDSSCVKDRFGNVVCGKGECAFDQYKEVFCGPQGGSAIKDSYGTVVCGIGHCAKDYLGQIWCSREPGGGAAVNRYKEVTCLGGCELATAELCEVAR